MAYQLPEKLQNLVPYSPLEGDYPIRLDANESFLSPPPDLLRQIGDAVEQVPFNRYPDPYCVALCEKFASFFGVRSSTVVAGNGSDELIGLIVSSFAGAGDRMAVVKPDFSMYAFYAQAAGVAVEVFEKLSGTLALDADALVAFAKERDVRLVILSNPCNPTSLSASRESVLRIVEGLPDRLVVIDEAYMDFSTGSILDVADRYDNLIVLKTCSKAFGMAAIRLGFAVSHPTLAIALKAAKPPYNVNSMTQAVGCLLFDHPDYLRACTRKIMESRDRLYREMKQLAEERSGLLEVVESCANFVFARFADPRMVFERAGERGIALRYMPPYLRISAGSETETDALLEALRQILM